MEARIDLLSDKLKRLRKIDRNFVVFGASGHRYKTKPWSQSDIEQLSHKAGVELPADLRLWLLSVGSGAGPNYDLKPCYTEPLIGMPHKDEFHGTFDQLTDVRLEDMQGLMDEVFSQTPDKEGYFEVPMITTRAEGGGAGLLSLGFAGCSYDYVMPLRGELRGKIFYRTEETIDDEGNEYGSVLWPQGFCSIFPSHHFKRDAKPTYRRNASELFSFLDWMEYWLDSSIYFVEHYDEYERQMNDWREEHLGWRDKPPNLLTRMMRRFRLR